MVAFRKVHSANRKVSKYILALVAALLVCLDVSAQQFSEISTDRPTFSVAPTTVGAGVWQGEFGYLTSEDNFGTVEQTIPQALIRWGFRDDMELRLDWPGYTRASAGGGSGFTDASIGIKWQLSDETGPFTMGLLAMLSLPVGASAVSSDSYDPTLGFLWTYSGAVNLFGQASATFADSTFAIDNGFGISFSVGLHGNLFFEHVMSIPESGGTAHSLNGGYAWLPSPDSQIDLHLGAGLNDRAPDYQLGVGYSRRFR